MRASLVLVWCWRVIGEQSERRQGRAGQDSLGSESSLDNEESALLCSALECNVLL